ncbi:MAG: RNA polymerase sigma factor [Gemmatimonadales bacterium]
MTGIPASFPEQLESLFGAQFPRLFRFLDRLSGDPDLAADLAQEAFVRLHRRGAMPDAPEAWLVSVALNLFRNSRSTVTRRRRLLAAAGPDAVHQAAAPSPDGSLIAEEERRQVRAAIDRMPERERQLLLLRGEGLSYRDLAAALSLNEASVGTLLARARRAFRIAYEGNLDAP